MTAPPAPAPPAPAPRDVPLRPAALEPCRSAGPPGMPRRSGGRGALVTPACFAAIFVAVIVAAATPATALAASPSVATAPTLPAAIGPPLGPASRQVARPLVRLPAAPDLLTAPRPAPGWHWPLPGHPEVTRRFDPPATPYGPGHRGVDLAAAPGTPVLAAGPGVVAWAGVLAGRGVVSVRHAGGLRTTYEPVSAAVRAGQRVAAGDRLGLLAAGHPGCPRPACLHWGLLRGSVYLDPLTLVGAGPVRLLPLGRTAAPAAPAAADAGGGSAPAPVASSAPRPVPSRQATIVALCFACAGVVLIRNGRWPP
jgi:murein DD-endopeptidase MepM/ murein hydrolase activator NlpD